MTQHEYAEMLRAALQMWADGFNSRSLSSDSKKAQKFRQELWLKTSFALATPPPTNKLRSMSEYKGDRPILRKHYAYGLMVVAPNRHSNKDDFPWMNVSYENTWPEEAFIGGWTELPEASE